MSNSLFRKEVTHAQNVGLEGRIILPSQPNLTRLAWAGVFLIIALICYAYFGQYTRKAKLSGVVMPASGLIKVVAPVEGRIQSILVTEGQEVARNAPLFILSGERYSRDGVGTLAKLRESIQGERLLVERERERRLQLNQLETTALVNKQQGLNSEVHTAQTALAIAEKRVHLQENLLRRNQQLQQQGFLSESASQRQEIELTTAQGEAEQARQNLLRLRQEIQSSQSDLEQARIGGENSLVELDRRLQQLEQQLIELGRQDSAMVRAPTAGVATAIAAKSGQSALQNETLLLVVPKNSELIVELYATSQSVGFIKPGQHVGLRFQAFPYEKYGIQSGVVREVTRAAQPPSELAQRTGLNLGNEGYYRVQVKLNKASVNVGNREEPLKVGMSTQGDVFLDTRSIYEWLFEPLSTLKG
ncbi:HlyD family efflux transporter periplasmic adaptor subunit [Jeongeupia chitinilytica]|uniref:Secretion protein n=1 Tax=Jeongeupia chitinilytica TaxID=1041641 RepID=A0ABQ3H0J8_9NEIS|nr:HlyD family efflux transporter periplasmic adaptor subunit [Jeongeupia chitinilytica]GHD64303.1 secretion protein [Jeongeupia chitinilytica]